MDSNIILQSPFCGFYHVHNWDHGYESFLGYNRTRREFYFDMEECISFIMDYIDYCKIIEFIVAPFHRINQFAFKDNNNDIYKEIVNFLKLTKLD